MTLTDDESTVEAVAEEEAIQSCGWQYGIVMSLLGPIPDWWWSELRGCNDLRNDLIDIQERVETMLNDLWASNDEVGPLIARREAMDARLDEVRILVSDKALLAIEKKAAREERAKLTADLKELRKRIRETKSEVKKRLQPQIEEIQTVEKNLKRDLLTYYASERIYWGNKSEINQKFRTSVKVMLSNRGLGAAAQLHKRPFRNEGTLAGQNMTSAEQRKKGHLRYTSALIHTDSRNKWKGTCVLPAICDEAHWDSLTPEERAYEITHATVRLRLGGCSSSEEKHWADVPIKVHRPIPANAEVTEYRVTLRRIGSTLHGTVVFSLRMPAPDPRVGPAKAAINLGWRRTETDIRVATVTASGVEFEDPGLFRYGVGQSLADVIRVSANRKNAEIVMPRHWNAIIDRISMLQSKKDDALNDARQHMLRLLEEGGPEPLYEAVEVEKASVIHWRKASGLYAILKRMEALDPSVLTRRAGLRHFRASMTRYSRLQNRFAVQWGKLSGQRTHTWRMVGHYFTLHLDELRVIPPFIAKVTKKKEDTSIGEEIAASVSRYQQSISAPGMLQALILQAMGKEGIRRIVTNPANISRMHYRCGGQLVATETHMSLCPTCDKFVDVDYNATENMLTAEV